MNPGKPTSPVRGERLEYAIARRRENANCEEIARELQEKTGERITGAMVNGVLARAQRAGVDMQPAPATISKKGLPSPSFSKGQLPKADKPEGNGNASSAKGQSLQLDERSFDKELPRTLTIDIETAPLKSYHWQMWRQNINPDMVQVDWSILAYAAKWLDRDEILYSDTSGSGAEKVRDDGRLVRELWDLLDTADIVITQNGKRFDIPRINARLIECGFGPYSPIKQVDTKIVAKGQFAFTSNRLAWLSKKLTTTPKSEHEKFPGFDLWDECLKDNPEAWAEMKKYNVQDVVATEAVYLKMRPWVIGHPNVANYKASDAMMCPKCSSPQLQKSGLWLTQTGEYTRYHCLDCGGWSRGRYTENALQKRHSLLSQ